MSKELLYTFLTFITVQSAVWFQTNGQFVWSWFKDHPFILSLFGIPISLGYIWGTKFAFAAFEGTLWPGRLLGFAMGIISFTILTNYFMGEGVSPKVMVSLILAILLVLIQVFWK